MTKKLELPSVDSERKLDNIVENSVDMVSLAGRKKKYPISWMKPGTRRKLAHVVLAKGNDPKVSCMGAALIILNDLWKIKFFYPILWRWFFYVRQYTDSELFPILSAGKKKVPLRPFLVNIILLTEMKDTIMTMKKQEAPTSLPERFMEQDGKAPKTTVG